MPPRKSNVSATPAGDEGQTPSKERDGVNIEDLSLPRTMVTRLAKGALPPNTMLSKDAVLAIQKAATVFVNHIAAQANDTTMASNRRTIPPAAVFEALKETEYESFIPRVQAELEKYTQVQASKRNDYRKKVKETKDGGITSTDQPGEAEDGEDVERGAKRARVSEGGEDRRRRDESPSAQLTMQAPERDWNPDEDPDDVEQGDEDDEEDGGVKLDGGGRADDEEEDEEEEEDDDDADEYPDEGHRAESLEMDDPAEEDERERRRRYAYGPSGEGGGGAGTSESEDAEMADG